MKLLFLMFCLLQSVATTNLYSVSVGLSVWTFHTGGVLQHVTFCVWFLSLHVFKVYVPVSLLHSTSCPNTLLYILTERYSTTFCLSSHLVVGLPAVVNIGAQVSVYIPFFKKFFWIHTQE